MLKRVKNHSTRKESVDVCDILILGTGIFNNYRYEPSNILEVHLASLMLTRWPDIPGLQDTFKGAVIHPAKWPAKFQAEQWTGKRLAVIGSGSTSIQIVPELQKHAKQVDVFVRTGVWFGNIGSNTGHNKVPQTVSAG